MLAHRAKLEEGEGKAVQSRPSGADSQVSRPADEQALNQQMQQQLQLAAAALQNPRAAVQNGVFRPSHQLPTISIEQQVGRQDSAQGIGMNASNRTLQCCQAAQVIASAELQKQNPA